MEPKYQVLIADDHLCSLQGLSQMIRQASDFEVVAEVMDGEAALEACQCCKPDFALIDLALPKRDGTQVTQYILEHYPETKVVIISMHSDRRDIEEVMRYKISGFIHKTDSSDYPSILRIIAQGKHYVSPEIASFLMDRETRQTPYQLLTKKEKELLPYFKEGLTSKEIAEKIHLSSKTVDSHRKNIQKKLALPKRDKASLIIYIHEHGLPPSL